jgi:cell division protein ZapA (FtsZ GTPase activity inhibitor)
MAKRGVGFGTKAFPADTKETSNLFRRVEQMITPETLVARYLKTIPAKTLQGFTPDDIKDQIEIAVNEFELLTDIKVYQTQMKERVPYDSQLYKGFMFMKMNHRPILSVEKVTVESTNGQVIYTVPLDWIERGFFHKGQINLLPIMAVFGNSYNTIVNGVPSGAMIFLQGQTGHQWLPAFWSVEYTTGVCHKDGNIPVIVNDVIGMIAAINILSDLQTKYIFTSQSLSQDGLSQSSSGPGPQTYEKRIEHLEQRKERLLQQLKKVTHNKYFLSNI